jgi:D-serine deaminase-like pyridoxal phosphate-dependent protein
MTPWPPDLGVRTVDHYTVQARRLRAQARSDFVLALIAAVRRYAVAPLAFGRRMCSSSRGNISTKLHGR